MFCFDIQGTQRVQPSLLTPHSQQITLLCPLCLGLREKGN